MTNKTVIRKNTEKNGFSIVQKSIIEDSRLTINGLRLLLSILGDDDESFNLSETLYCVRLNINKKSFSRAIKNLIECGYIKKTLIGKDKFIPGIKKANSNKIVYYYTISEFGNLKSKLEKIEPTAEPTAEPIQELEPEKFELTNDDYIKIDSLIVSKEINCDVESMLDYINEAIKTNKLTSSSQLTEENILKMIKKFQIINEKIKTEPITDKMIEVWCDEYSSGITIQSLKSLKLKVKKRISESEEEWDEKRIRTKILQIKTEYIKHSNVNQD